MVTQVFPEPKASLLLTKLESVTSKSFAGVAPRLNAGDELMGVLSILGVPDKGVPNFFLPGVDS